MQMYIQHDMPFDLFTIVLVINMDRLINKFSVNFNITPAMNTVLQIPFA